MKKTIILLLIIFAVVAIAFTSKHFKSNASKQVEIEDVAKHIIKASILASGRLKHEQEVKLSAEVIGKVTKLYVAEGDQVKQNQLLLEIDDQAFVAAVEQHQAIVNQQKTAIKKQRMVVENLQKQWHRKSKLFKHKLLDSDAFEAITHQFEVSKMDLKSSFEYLKQVEASLQQSKDQLSKTKVLSPITGIITSLDIKRGETAISGTTNITGSSLMTIADPNSMIAELNVDEADIANVKIGQNAEIIAVAFAGRPMTATVESIASSAKIAAGRQSLSFAVKLKLLAEDIIALRSGMSCRAEVFTRGEQNLLAVPIRAVQTKEDNENNSVNNFVFVYQDGIAKKVKVKTGTSDDSFQQIIEGLQAGVSIITGPDKIVRHLRDGDKVSAQITNSN